MSPLSEIYPEDEIKDVFDEAKPGWDNWDGSELLRAERVEKNVLMAFRYDDWQKALGGYRSKHALVHAWLDSPSADLCRVRGFDRILIAKPDKEPLFHQFTFW